MYKECWKDTFQVHVYKLINSNHMHISGIQWSSWLCGSSTSSLGSTPTALDSDGVLAPPCIDVNLYPKGFVCIDLLSEIPCRAANPVIDQGTRIDQNFSIEDLEVEPGVVDSLSEPVTTLSCQSRLN